MRLILALSMSLVLANIAKAGSNVVLVELFTSEGCSSCPSADKVFSALKDREDVALLAWHVDYWDKLGWKDRFGHEEATPRQERYAAALNGGRLYTPQMVVNGQAEFVGSDSVRAKRTIDEAVKADGIPVSARLRLRDGSIHCEYSILSISEEVARGNASVFVALTEDNLLSEVTAGENSGRTLHHDGVVREFRKLQRVDKTACEGTWGVIERKEWKQRDLKAVVFVQEESTGRILGATVAKLGE